MSRTPRPLRNYTPAMHRQRGAAAVFFAVGALALVTTVMLGFNVGQLYYAQRNLERQAALAALVGAQVASGCLATSGGNGVPGSQTAVNSAVTSSLGINAGTGATLPAATATLGRIDRSSTNSKYNVFVPLAAGSTGIDSVQVLLTQTQPSVLAAALFAKPSQRTLAASATATQSNTAEFSVGTTLASLSTNQSALLNSLLGGVLGSSVNISAVGYNGLANANVSLQSLMVAAGVTNLNSLLAVSTTLPTALGYLSTALNAGTGTTSAAAAALVATLGSGASASTNVTFGDVLGSALGTAFNPVVGDAVSAIPFVNGAALLMALAEDAAAKSGSNYQLTIPVALQIPGVTNTYLFLQAIQPAQYAIGPVGTSAKSAQLILKLRLQIGSNNGLLGLLDVVAVNIGLDISLANGSGTLSQLQCPTATNSNPSASINVTSSVATLKLGAFSGAATSAPPVTGGAIITSSLLGIPLVTIGLSNPVTAPVGSASNSVVGPYTSFNTPVASVSSSQPADTYTTTGTTGVQTVGSASLLSTSVPGLVNSLTTNSSLSVIGGLLPILTSITSVASQLNALLLTPLASALDGVVSTVLQLLGIQVGQVTIDLQNVVIGAPVVSSFCSPSNPSPGVPGC